LNWFSLFYDVYKFDSKRPAGWEDDIKLSFVWKDNAFISSRTTSFVQQQNMAKL